MPTQVNYIPSIKRLLEIAESPVLLLSVDDQRHIHRIKNWLREKDEKKKQVSAAKVNFIVNNKRARGITI